MEPIHPNPVVQQLTDPSIGPRRMIPPSHPSLADREPDWALKEQGVGLAASLALGEMKAASQRGGRWANRGVDAVFGPSVEEAYEARFRRRFSTHKSRLQGTARDQAVANTAAPLASPWRDLATTFQPPPVPPEASPETYTWDARRGA